MYGPVRITSAGRLPTLGMMAQERNSEGKVPKKPRSEKQQKTVDGVTCHKTKEAGGFARTEEKKRVRKLRLAQEKRNCEGVKSLPRFTFV